MSKKRSYDKYIRHQIWLRGQSTRIANVIVEILNNRESDLMSKITTKAFKGPRNLNAVIKSVYENIDEIYKEISESLTGEVEKLAEFQSSWMLGAIASRKEIKVDTSVLLSQVLSDPFDGKLLSEWIVDQSVRVKTDVRKALRIGVSQSKSVRDIVADIQDTAWNKGKRETVAMVRTATNHTISTADNYVYRKANIKRYQYVCIIDSSTTPQCVKADTLVFGIDDKDAVRPPLHINCRSFTVPIQDDEDIIKESYKDWLERQSEKEQISILGPSRHKLWKGGLPLGKFVDTDYHVIPLSDLKSAV